MAAAYMLLLLPALALASIEVDVSGTFDPNNPNIKVNLSGNQVDIISDQERSTFKLSDSQLKDAVRAHFGKRPDDAYLRSPTPWGDLYKSYGWSQVTRALVPKSQTIIGIQSQPMIVMQQVFENNSSKSATFDVGITQEVENTVTSSWSKDGSLTVGQEIHYGFDIEVAKGGGTTSFSYSSSWGENYEKSETITVGSSSSMNVVLKPGEAVVAVLQATRGTIKVQVEYEASLSGDSAVNYSSPYKGHHFWGLGIDAIMNSGGISNKVTSREVIEIGFYSNSKVSVHDKASGRSLMSSSQ